MATQLSSTGNPPPNQTPPPSLPPASTQPPQNSINPAYEKLHYDKHIEFFKWMVGIAGSIIALIASVAVYTSYSSIKDFKAEYRESLKEYREEANTSKNDVKSAIESVKRDATSTLLESEKRLNDQVPIILNKAENLALDAVNRSIENQFQEKNIRELIETTADVRLKGQVGSILDKKIKSTTEGLDQQTKAAAYFMIALDQLRVGNKVGLKMLDSLKSRSNPLIIREIADDLIRQKQKDYENFLDVDWSVSNDDLFKVQLPDRFQYKNFDDLINQIVNRINNSNDLYEVAVNTHFLRKIVGIHFDMFDFNKVDKWFRTEFQTNKDKLEKNFLQKIK